MCLRHIRKLHTSVVRQIIVQDLRGRCCKTRPFKDPVRLRRATSDDVPRIIQHLRLNYFHEEPLMRSLGICGSNPVYESFAQSDIAEGLSLVAHPICDKKKVVGVIINSANCPWDADRIDLFAECIKCSHTRKLVHFDAHVTRQPALHQRYSTLKIFEMSMVSVDNCARRVGIAEKLCRQSLFLARDLGYSIARINCSSFYIAKMAKKLGMTMVWEMPYKSYLDCNHEPMLKPDRPHTHVQVFIYRLKRCGQSNAEIGKLYNLNYREPGEID